MTVYNRINKSDRKKKAHRAVNNFDIYMDLALASRRSVELWSTRIFQTMVKDGVSYEVAKLKKARRVKIKTIR